MKTAELVHACEAYVRDMCRSAEFRDWCVELESPRPSGLRGVRAFRGEGRDIEYGFVWLDDKQVQRAVHSGGADAVIELFRERIREAIREAGHREWLKGRPNGQVIGIAGRWRKWAA